MQSVRQDSLPHFLLGDVGAIHESPITESPVTEPPITESPVTGLQMRNGSFDSASSDAPLRMTSKGTNSQVTSVALSERSESKSPFSPYTPPTKKEEPSPAPLFPYCMPFS